MRVISAFVILTLTGCTKPPAESAQAKADLGSIVLQYHQYVGEHREPPTHIDELAEFEAPFGWLQGNATVSSQCTTSLRSGNYVVIWSYNIAEDLQRNESVILAYHRDVPTSGGYVAFADGRARSLNKEQFAATDKASPTKASISD
ncbi:hypothetical protein Pla52o_45100 [Novipirellula galeiformis]|uniref:Lipoprotein n=1 Tax=Novipirellula galeiformis TaxID=2528004 RepID=A0A5C6C8Y1_9BACT|nr:hypothetical protein [Novipirellula galeiformis]TWU20632.1 hypothetical protein Pla52o_45100 [Novipirellula galeiformis]